MNSYLAMSLATGYNTIAYGSVAAGSNMSTLSTETRTEMGGNVSIDVSLSGTDMQTADTLHTIALANQKYGLGASAPAWASGTVMSGSPVHTDLNSGKSGYSGLATKPVWWGINIPAAQFAGSYTGTNTITATKDDESTLAAWGAPN